MAMNPECAPSGGQIAEDRITPLEAPRVAAATRARRLALGGAEHSQSPCGLLPVLGPAKSVHYHPMIEEVPPLKEQRH